MADIIDMAIKDLGYTEEGGNYTKFGAWIGCNYQPWCHSSASYWAWKSGIGTDIVPRTPSTTVGMNWFKSKGRFALKGLYTPERNDFVYFKTGRSHVGIVEYARNGYLHTIEGNTSNKVARRTYLLSNATITGYGRVSDYIANKTTNTTTNTTLNVGAFGALTGVSVKGSWTSTSSKNTATKNTTTVTNTSTNSSSSSSKKSKKQYDASQELALLKKFLNSLDDKKSDKIDNKKYNIIKYTAKQYTMHVYLVQSETKAWELCVEDDLTITLERSGSAGVCEFKSYKKGIKYQNGDVIIIKAGSTTIFYGYIFSIKQSGDHFLNITAYDQLRYLKNKSTEIFSKKTLSQCITTLGKKFKLNIGKLANTSYKQSLIADDITLFEMIEQMQDNELMYKGNDYVLFDNKGKLRLVKQSDMYYNNYYVSWNVCEDVDYESTIDDGYYNKVSLVYENDDTGTYEKYEYKDSKSINKYGLLQYTGKIQTQNVGKLKAQALLRYYNQVKRMSTVKGCNGDINVRAGTILPVYFCLEECTIRNFMIVQKVTHHFTANRTHTMDLVLKGGVINNAG